MRRPPAAEEIVHTTLLLQYNYGMREAETLNPDWARHYSSLRTVDQVPHCPWLPFQCHDTRYIQVPRSAIQICSTLWR
jgi:hypothetical protein